jgi:hypothetical protein
MISWGYSTGEQQDDIKQPSLENKFIVELTLPEETLRSTNYKLYTISIVGDYEVRSIHILCNALFRLGYLFSYPASYCSIHVIATRFTLLSADIKAKTMLDCEIGSDFIPITELTIHDQRFQSAYIRAIYMKLLSFPQWSSSYNEDLEDGVVLRLDEPDNNNKGQLQRTVKISLNNLSCSGEGNMLDSL